MRSIPEETRIIMNTRRNFVNYARVVLHDGTVLNLTPSDFRISGNSFTDDWNEGETFSIGSAIGKTATLLLDNTDGRVDNTFTLQTSKPSNWDTHYTDYYTYDGATYHPIRSEVAPTWVADTYYTLTNSVSYPHGKFSEYDFYMAYFELKVVLPDGYHDAYDELQDVELFIGTFTVTTPASHGATIEITGVDNMYRFDRSFDECQLDFSVSPTLSTLLTRCCTDCNVAQYTTSFLNMNIQVTKKPENVTYRQVVSWIAQIAGCNAKIIPSGALKLDWYDMTVFSTYDGGRFRPWDGVDNTRDTLDGGSFNPWTTGDVVSGGNFSDPLGYHNLTATNGTTVSTDTIKFTGVMVSYNVEEEGSSVTKSLHWPNTQNWDTYAMKIEGNALIETQSIANTVALTVWDAIKDLEFRVFSCSAVQDPTIEAGDCAIVYDVKGNIYRTIITNMTFKTGGMTDVSCTAQSPISQNTRYVNPAATMAIRKSEENMDAYNAMVARFNELAFAATAYTKVPGELVDPQYADTTFLCDHGTYASSTNIVWITGNGAFISTDGGRSYNTGLDVSTATLLMNYIYVHGVTADWIKVNKLEAISALMGTVYVGGGSNGDGILYVRNASNATIVTLNNNGIDIDGGDINLGNGVFHVTNAGVVTASSLTITGGVIKLGNKTSLTDANTGVYIGSDGLALGASSVFKVTSAGALTATSIDIKGKIQATSGSIGSNSTEGNRWQIGDTSIYNGCNAINGSGNGTYVGTNGIRNKNGDSIVTINSGTLTANNVEISGGHLKIGSKFEVASADGKLTCSDIWIKSGTIIIGSGSTTYFSASSSGVSVNGNIKATSGTIGSDATEGNRWQIGAYSIYNGCSGVGTDAEGTYVGKNGIRNQKDTGDSKKYVQITNGKLTANSVAITGTGGTASDNAINLNGVFKVTNAGALTCSNVKITGSGGTASDNAINLNGKFKVTNAGALTATSAVIGGWTIGDLEYNGGSSPVTVQAFYKGTNLGKANTLLLCPEGYKVFALQNNDIRFGWANNSTGDSKLFSFGVGTKFGVTHDGDLFARNATVSGTISSSSGEIGPWSISSSGLSNNDDGAGAWIKPLEIACGKHSATLVKMIGTTSGSGSSGGYLSVEVNSSSDYVRVYTNDIKKKTSSGTVSVQWNTSDRRVKKNIEDLTLTEAINLINNVLPRKFEMKDEPGIRYGFIAQELREVLDDDCAIEFSTSKDEDDYRAVHYEDFIAPLCMIVKDQQKTIDKQQEEINDLKERLAKLESIVNTIL